MPSGAWLLSNLLAVATLTPWRYNTGEGPVLPPAARFSLFRRPGHHTPSVPSLSRPSNVPSIDGDTWTVTAIGHGFISARHLLDREQTHFVWSSRSGGQIGTVFTAIHVCKLRGGALWRLIWRTSKLRRNPSTAARAQVILCFPGKLRRATRLPVEMMTISLLPLPLPFQLVFLDLWT